MKVEECFKFVDEFVDDPLNEFTKYINFLKPDTECEGKLKDPKNPVVYISCNSNSDFSEFNTDNIAIFKKSRGVFFPKNNAIILMADNLTPAELRSTLKHESIHAVDHFINKMDLELCRDVACSEIRASSASECENYIFRKNCARVRAVYSTTSLHPKYGVHCVDMMLKDCIDSPLIYKLSSHK